MGINANADFIHRKQQKVKEILAISTQDILTEQKSWTNELRCAQETISYRNSTESTIFQNLPDVKEIRVVTTNKKRKEY